MRVGVHVRDAAFLIVVTAVVAYSLDSAVTWRFPENEQYGYVCVKQPADTVPGEYLLVRFNGYSPVTSAGWQIIDSITSSTAPQLCDSYAVSYTVRQNDSAHLVVAYIDRAPRHDTIMTYLNDLSRVSPRGIMKLPDNRVFCLDKYCLVLRDSVLVWGGNPGRREFIEIGRIGPAGAYMTRSFLLCAFHPTFATDFSHVLFSAYMCGPAPSSDWNTRILAYHPDEDTVLLIHHSEQSCVDPQRRTATGDLYCLVSDSTGFSLNLGRIQGDSIIPLTQFSPPESISDYYLFKDSIVIVTTRRCEPGFSKWTLIEGETPSLRPSR